MPSSCVCVCVSVCLFSNFQNGRRRHLGFLKLRNFIGYLGGEGRDASARQISSNRSFRCADIAIFRFFKMAAATILDCRICKILKADAVSRSRAITVANFAKKIRRSIAEILRFFEFLRWPPPPSWIFKIAKFYWLIGWRGSRRISMPNFVKIGKSVAKILRFFDFLRWRPPSSWIVEFAKFYRLTVFRGTIRITLPNFIKIGFSLRIYCNFWNFQNGRRRHLGFFKSWNFIGYWGGENRDTSACQILLKSVNRLRRY